MRSPFRILLIVALALHGTVACAASPALTADQIIARHIEARGGRDRIRALTNLVYSGGTYEEGDYTGDGSATMSLGRPYFKLVGDKRSPGGYMEGYDGSAWEWFGDPGVVIRTVGKASEAIRHYAGVDGPLLDYRAQGASARYLGETELNGNHVQVVELTRRDGFIEQFYFDRHTYMIVASGGAAPIHAFGDDVVSLTYISDYRTVEGVEIAHRFESMELPSKRSLSSMQWGRVEANVDLPDDWFSPPQFKRTRLAMLIEHLYGQRDDLTAIEWTYHEFRRAHGDAEMANAVNIAGFQILKMGQIANAIALLEQNVLDNPGVAECRFGLGRAYRRAGRDGEARGEFEHALRIDPRHQRAAAALAEMGKQ